MTASIQELVDEIIPERTVLIFGAGASIPSDAPSVANLIARISRDFKIDSEGLTLSEISGLAERKRNRRDLIAAIRDEFKGVRGKGSILNLPLYDWKSIYSTNYDEIVEYAYSKADKKLTVFSSNFDFTIHTDASATKLFKIHGTLKNDVSDGHASRLILTDLDYDQTQDYREALYLRLAGDLTAGTHVVIIGQSLADPDLREVVQRAISINQKAMGGGRIALLLYTPDQNRAALFEARGLRVAFGGLDDFFLHLARKSPQHVTAHRDSGDFLEFTPALRPVTWTVSEELDTQRADVSAIFNGWPARYADIVMGFTFERNVAKDILNRIHTEQKLCAVLLGASGVGKTTAARQAMRRLQALGFAAWEHKTDHALNPDDWFKVSERLESSKSVGVLMVDEAHSQLHAINELVDRLSAANRLSLRLVLISTRNHWGPRIKTPTVYLSGPELSLSQLNGAEIDRLLSLVETIPAMRSLVEAGFGGFSRQEQRRRLVDRCEADMFVCLKNIFATEKFDDIILREYAGLEHAEQEIYRYVAAMEHSGIRVHRQLVMRLLGLQANGVASTLDRLTEIISEYTVSDREGVYGWRVRHPVIASIVAKYKFADVSSIIDLFAKVIDQISPTYDIEIRTIRELCNIESGLSVIPDKAVQNHLLRKMMSIAPGERVPRHRLIRNLIDMGEFEKAESEIRIFEKDFRRDGPVVRYRILLMIARATLTPDLLREDRIAILSHARELAASAVNQYAGNKAVLGAYCEVGIEFFKFTGEPAAYDAAMDHLRKAEVRLGDPDITRMIVRYERRLSAQTPNPADEQADTDSIVPTLFEDTPTIAG